MVYSSFPHAVVEQYICMEQISKILDIVYEPCDVGNVN